MDEITFKRLQGLISLVTDNSHADPTPEARTAAVLACKMIKKHNLLNYLQKSVSRVDYWESNFDYTPSQPAPKSQPKSPQPKPKPKQKEYPKEDYDLNNLNFMKIYYTGIVNLSNRVLERFIEHLEYKAKQNSYPIYSVKEIIQILISEGKQEASDSFFNTYIREIITREVERGTLSSKRGRNGGYFLKH